MFYRSAKTKPQWLGFWGGDDGAYCAFPTPWQVWRGTPPFPSLYAPPPPPLTQNPVSAPEETEDEETEDEDEETEDEDEETEDEDEEIEDEDEETEDEETEDEETEDEETEDED